MIASHARLEMKAAGGNFFSRPRKVVEAAHQHARLFGGRLLGDHVAYAQLAKAAPVSPAYVWERPVHVNNAEN